MRPTNHRFERTAFVRAESGCWPDRKGRSHEIPRLAQLSPSRVDLTSGTHMEACPPPATARRDALAVWRSTGCTTAPSTRPTHDPVPALYEAFRALHDALAKFNASIRLRYPKSSPLARAMARSTWGPIGGAPFLVADLEYIAQDALYAERGAICRFRDDVAEILHTASAWAEPAHVYARRRRDRRKSVSIVERGLFDLIRTRSDVLYDMCVGLPGVKSTKLPKRQRVRCQFKRKLDAMEGALRRARKDPEPSYKLLLMLRTAVPPDCAARIMEYVA